MKYFKSIISSNKSKHVGISIFIIISLLIPFSCEKEVANPGVIPIEVFDHYEVLTIPELYAQHYPDSNFSCDALILDEGKEFNIHGYFNRFHLNPELGNFALYSGNLGEEFVVSYIRLSIIENEKEIMDGIFEKFDGTSESVEAVVKGRLSTWKTVNYNNECSKYLDLEIFQIGL